MGLLDDYGLGVKSYFSSHHEWVSAAVFGAFTLTNSLRVLAYVPQMLKAARDENGASAVSYSTWTLFLVSHLTTIAYALVGPGDLVMASIFLANAFACLTIIAITFVKRRRYAARLGAASETPVLPARSRRSGRALAHERLHRAAPVDPLQHRAIRSECKRKQRHSTAPAISNE
jgi:hypothetical protein